MSLRLRIRHIRGHPAPCAHESDRGTAGWQSQAGFFSDCRPAPELVSEIRRRLRSVEASCRSRRQMLRFRAARAAELPAQPRRAARAMSSEAMAKEWRNLAPRKGPWNQRENIRCLLLPRRFQRAGEFSTAHGCDIPREGKGAR